MAKANASTGAHEKSVVDNPCAGVRAAPVLFAAPSDLSKKPPEGPMGTVTIGFSGTGPTPDEARIFFTRHASERGRQHVLVARAGKEVHVELPVGEYSLQIQARGLEVYRTLVEIEPNRPAKVVAAFEPRKSTPRTFEERLAKYGVDASNIEIVDLDVAPRTVVQLNHADKCCDKRGFRMLYADSIEKIKQWVGSDDAKFGHERPVFGSLPSMDTLPQLDGDVDPHTLSNKDVQSIKAIAREYVSGNSRSVQRYAPLLNVAIKLTTRDFAAKMFPFFFYKVVTIGAGATLEVGNGSAIFSCDELRIHKTGKLKPVNDVTIEIGTYKEFG